jgi:YidC/Oxa1 family membrane protein insertase
MLVIANVLQPLIDIADAILVFLHDQLAFGWGMAIVGMTVIVRLAILPLTIKGVRSMNALRELQPEMKKIQEKYKGRKDPQARQQMNQEMMRFYRENKVNPFSSCLPLLLQIPVFLALFYLLRGDEFRDRLTPESQDWLFITNLAEKETDLAVLALIVLYVASQLGASLVMMSTVTDPTQRILFLLLPVAFIPFIITFPAGLIVYWITTNVWTFGQQVVVRKIAPPPQLAPMAGGEDDGEKAKKQKKPPPPPRRKKRRR